MGSTSVLERIELTEQSSPMFKCEMVWALARDGTIAEECGKEATFLGTFHANANSRVKPCCVSTKYCCGTCLAKAGLQWCDRHSTAVLIGYTKL